MELLLEFALEAVVFRYSTSLAGYIWTILALFAAALSLWRFRFLGSRSKSESASKSPANTAPVSTAVVSSTPAIVPSPIVTPHFSDRMETESSTKGRFTVYLLAEEETDGDGEDEERVSDGFSSGMGCLDCSDWGWKGDLGWYAYQDRTAINGTVVKLWDSDRKRFPLVPAVWERWN